MPYQFKLEALRRYRLFQEEVSQKELADAQRVCDLAMNELKDTLAMRDKTESDLQHKQAEATFGPQVAVYHRFLRKLAGDIVAQQCKVQAAQSLCNQRRAALLEAVKKRKALEKLKQNGIKAYLANLDQKEAKFINEIAINRFSWESRTKENASGLKEAKQ